jgi:hypothetical protein
VTWLALLTRYWRELGMALLAAAIAGLWILHSHDAGLLRECKAARAEDQMNVRATTAKAQADDTMHALTVERRNATATQETERDLQAQIASARAAAAVYAARLRNQVQATDGGVGLPSVPAAPDPARPVAGAGEASVMDADTEACAVAVVKAEGWQGWFARVSSPIKEGATR